MKKLLLLSLMAIIPCAMLVSGNNGAAPQLSGAKSAPMQSYSDMNDQEGMSCPTDEEILSMLEQEMPAEEWAAFKAQYDEFKNLTPEQQQEVLLANAENMISQLPPEQQEELALLGIEEMFNALPEEGKKQVAETADLLGEVANQAYNRGAIDTENKIIQEAQAILPVLQEAIIEEEAAMAKNCPYTPAIK